MTPIKLLDDVNELESNYNMINWISDNKEWLFSGAGFSIFGGIVFIVNKLKKPQPQELAFDESVYKTSPYPSDITKSVKNSEPLQQKKKQESYIGLKVNWLTTFESANEADSKGNVKLMLMDRGSYPWIFCYANISQYPELKSASKMSNISVFGEIIRVDSGTIDIKVDQLKF